LYKTVFRSFSLLTVWVCNFFWQQNIGTKAAHKMLVKLKPGANFTNILLAAFGQEDLKSAKIVKSSGSFCAFGIFEHKSCFQNVGEIKT